jgi:hypothetical protein
MSLNFSLEAKKAYETIKKNVLENGMNTAFGNKLSPEFMDYFFGNLSDVQFYYLYSYLRSKNNGEYVKTIYISKHSIKSQLYHSEKSLKSRLLYLEPELDQKFIERFQYFKINLDTQYSTKISWITYGKFLISKRAKAEEFFLYLQENYQQLIAEKEWPVNLKPQHNTTIDASMRHEILKLGLGLLLAISSAENKQEILDMTEVIRAEIEQM